MTSMDSQQIAKDELQLPRLGFGAGSLGDPWEVIPDQSAARTIQSALDAGIRYFDTAPWYGLGKSEQRLGQVLPNVPRDRFCITTKVGRILKPAADPNHPPYAERWAGGNPMDLTFDYTRDGQLRSLDDSLDRLNLERVDAVLIHDLDAKFFKTPEELESRLGELESGGGFEALRQLKRAGTIRAIGAGINLAEMIPVLLDRFEIDFFLVAMPYTLLDQNALEVELAQCIERGVNVLIGSPFASGVLLNSSGLQARYGQQPAEACIVDKVQSIKRIADQHGVDMLAASLQFPLAHPAVTTVIPGIRTEQEVRQAVAAMSASIPDEFWSVLKARALLHPMAPVPKKTEHD